MQVQVVNNLAFKARLDGYSKYGREYLDFPQQDAPDQYLLKQLELIDQNPQDVQVLDLGAGQGRNSTFLAQEGYHVVAVEATQEGCNCISDAAKSVDVVKGNILDLNSLPLPKNRFQFAFMSHVTQHFSPGELRQVLAQAKEFLAPKGALVFDALRRTNPKYKKYDVTPSAIISENFPNLERYGAASFDEGDILSAAKDVGLSFVKSDKFNEIGKRPWYERQNLWGEFRILDYLDGIFRKPVKLKWFVFRK